MPIPFTCPHCGTRTDVAERLAGRSGPCGNCGKTITVPPAGTISGGTAAKDSSSGLAGVAAGLGVPLVVVLGFLSVVLVCGGILVALLLPAVQSARQTGRRTQCKNNLQNIATAVFQYRLHYDVFPPPYIADPNGRPMHSWRMLILPFMGEQTLYDRYNLDQPWDGPDNLALAGMIPQIYRCPDDSQGPATETSYLMIVGPGTFSSVTGPRQIDEFPDGPVNTLMLVETAGSGIGWTQPRDYEVLRSSLGVNDPAGGGISSRHGGGANAAMCEGSVVFLNEWNTAEDVRAMATIAGGEGVGKPSAGF